MKLAPDPQHLRWLMELTSLPSASGREGAVVRWVRDWAARRRSLRCEADAHGNLWVCLRHAQPTDRPTVIAAHMDHPAFVVTRVRSPRELEADFRGGVDDGYFVGSRVLLHAAGATPRRGVVASMTPASRRTDGVPDRAVTVRFARPIAAQPGDVITWDTGAARVLRGQLHTLACDNLAGVAAALAALASLGAGRERADVRVLLTRAEEVGFIGAIAACLSGSLPTQARVVVLENSRSFAESPIGGGPILRVGDRTSTFDPELTHRLGAAAQELAATDVGFTWQRKLMPGGTCEATAYQALGHRAACLCLPLGRYHNMDTQRQRIAAEHIALSDFAGLVRWLVHAAPALARDAAANPLADRMRSLHASRRPLLDEPL